MIDTYNTISNKSIGEGFYSEKRSKFLAFTHHVENAEQAIEIVKQYKKKYYGARHCCYAYRMGYKGEEFRVNDDGEPSSTAGKPILGQLLSNNLTFTLICVIRYFGGVKLGTSRLIVAYKQAAIYGIKNSIIEKKYIERIITYRFSFYMLNSVMKIVKEFKPKIINQTFDNECSITLSIRISLAAQLESCLNKLTFNK